MIALVRLIKKWARVEKLKWTHCYFIRNLPELPTSSFGFNGFDIVDWWIPWRVWTLDFVIASNYQQQVFAAETQMAQNWIGFQTILNFTDFVCFLNYFGSTYFNCISTAGSVVWLILIQILFYKVKGTRFWNCKTTMSKLTNAQIFASTFVIQWTLDRN